MRWLLISLCLDSIMAAADVSLIKAAKTRDPRKLGTLLAQNPLPDVNEQDSKGRSVLFISSALGDIASVAMLCHKGADVNIPTNFNTTALHAAVDGNYYDICRVLCKRNININHQSNNGDTPLHIAAMRGHKQIVEFLLDKGADPGLFNKNGRTPLQEAVLASSSASRPEQLVHDDIIVVFRHHLHNNLKQNNLNGRGSSEVRRKSAFGHHLELASNNESNHNSQSHERQRPFSCVNIPLECTPLPFGFLNISPEHTHVTDRNNGQGLKRRSERGLNYISERNSRPEVRIKSPEYHNSFDDVTREQSFQSSRHSDPPTLDYIPPRFQRYASAQNLNKTPERSLEHTLFKPDNYLKEESKPSNFSEPNLTVTSLASEKPYGDSLSQDPSISLSQDPSMVRLCTRVENLQMDVVRERERRRRRKHSSNKW